MKSKRTVVGVGPAEIRVYPYTGIAMGDEGWYGELILVVRSELLDSEIDAKWFAREEGEKALASALRKIKKMKKRNTDKGD